MNRGRVVLGMSGGVDSSVAGWLLREQGYEVVGITAKVWPQDCMSRAEDKCCGPQAVADARMVAHRLGIAHYVVDEAADFQRLVIDYFTSEYRAGRTPNPCVMCNEKVKFGNLLEKARRLGARYIATGHYARVEHAADGPRLFRAVDRSRDQSYFLFSLRPEQLSSVLMPVGGLAKPEVRRIARELGLKVHDKADSQEICFVPGNDYTAFLRSHLGETDLQPGGIYDLQGHRIGEHEGIEFYTVGQRRGLPGGMGLPRYVVDIDAARQRVIVGTADDLLSREFRIDSCNWTAGAQPGEAFPCEVKIRYNQGEFGARVTPHADGSAQVVLDEPQRAVTPGQACVCYDGDRVLGGGWIARTASTGAGVESAEARA
jgi:tRNA-specific 2-thiouridylase